MLFLESPWPILVLGLLVEAVLAAALFRSGRGALLWAMAGTALVVLLGVLVERTTITDTKLVRQTLQAVAVGLQANSAAAVKSCIVPDADGDLAREKTDWALGQGEFREVSIGNLEVKFNYRTSPATAVATFIVYVRGRLRGGMVQDELSRPVAVEVKLRKEAGRWLVYDEVKTDVHE